MTSTVLPRSVPPREVDVAIVGAGPHGLSAALHLLDRDPSLLGSIAVLDPRAGWMGAWAERLARQRIEHLRSPGIHHPGPDPHGLGSWVGNRHPTSGLSYGIPVTETFARYCAHLVEEAGLADVVEPCGVADLDPGGRGCDLVLTDGTRLRARHVVLAVDPARRCIPPWVDGLLPTSPDSLVHSADIDLRTAEVTAAAITVVGGGLTAGHLACGAVASGAEVTIVSRRPLRESMFDTEPGWLGPMHLDGYRRLSDPTERARTAIAARDGGSLPPWMARRLRSLASEGRVRLIEGADVRGAYKQGDQLELVLADERRVRGDKVWLATGTRADATAHRLTRQLLAAAPIELVDGWPVLGDRSLRWPATTVHIMGRLATIPLGPAAGNLWGARVAAVSIAEDITGIGGTTSQGAG